MKWNGFYLNINNDERVTSLDEHKGAKQLQDKKIIIQSFNCCSTNEILMCQY